MKKAICLLLAALMCALCAAALADYDETFVSGNFTYYLDDDGNATVCAYDGPGGALVIPEALGGHAVTGVGEMSYANRNAVTSLYLPDSVTHISGYICCECEGLQEVRFSPNIRCIPYTSFHNCTSLDNVVIPEGVEEIEGAAFTGCSSLKTITLPRSLAVFPPDEEWGPDGMTIYGYEGSAASCFSGFVPLPEDVYTSGSYRYVLTDSGCAIIGYSGDESALTVPAELGGHPVTAIRGGFCRNDALTSVTIPGSVKEIGGSAFEDCVNLTEVHLAEGLETVGAMAFGYCDRLDQVNLPATVTRIGKYTFRAASVDHLVVNHDSYAERWCQINQVGFEYPDGTSGELSDFRFYQRSDTSVVINDYCGEDTDIAIPAQLYGMNVVGVGAFDYNWLTSVQLPDSLTFIEDGAFSNSYKLTEIVIPDSVTRIEYGAFRSSKKLASAVIPASVTRIDEYAFTGCPDLVITLEQGSAAEEYCQANAIPYRYGPDSEIIVPEVVPKTEFTYYVQDDGTAVISGCTTNVGDITVPAEIDGHTVVGIGWRAFHLWGDEEDATLLTRVTLPDTVTFIDEEAFERQKSLAEVRFSANLTRIGKAAFQYCRALEAPELPDTLTSMGRGAFYGCGMTEVTVPGSLAEIPEYAFGLCQNLKRVTISSGVTSIGPYAFANCVALERVAIPSGVTSIGQSAFSYCDALEYVSIPASVTTIRYAFDQSPNVTAEVAWRSKAENFCKSYGIPYTYFPGNETDFHYILLDDGTAAIDDFRTSVSEITVPSEIDGYTVTRIESFAFCFKDEDEEVPLTRVTLPDTITCIEDSAFRDQSQLIQIRLSANLVQLGDTVFLECERLKEIELPPTLVTIGRSAFSGCSALERAVIPASVQEIGDSAFDECYRLVAEVKHGSVAEAYCQDNDIQYVFGSGEVVQLPPGTTAVGAEAFADCLALVEVRIPEGVVSIGDGAFRNCANLVRVTIPASATEFGADIFAGCSSNLRAIVREGSYADIYCSQSGIPCIYEMGE